MFDQVARCLVLIGLTFLPFSPTFGDGIFVAAILSLFGGNLKHKFSIIFSYQSSYWLFILLLVMGISIFYNPMGIAEGFHYFYKHLHRFISLLLVLPLFIEKKWRTRAIQALLIGATVSIVISLFSVPFYQKQIHYPPIPYSIYLALVNFIALTYCLNDKAYLKKILYGLVFLLSFIFLIFFNIERTGILVLFALLFLFIWQRWGIKGAWLALIPIVVLSISIYHVSPKMHYRVNQAISDIKNYEPNSWTSLGLRYNYLKYSVPFIFEHPLIGHGMGTFAKGNLDVIDASMNNKQTDPENSYLQLLLQTGIIGLSIFLGWLFISFKEIRKLPLLEKHLLQGVFLSLVVSAFCVSSFMINLSATTFVTLYAVLLSALWKN